MPELLGATLLEGQDMNGRLGPELFVEQEIEEWFGADLAAGHHKADWYRPQTGSFPS